MTQMNQVDFTGVTPKNLSNEVRAELRVWREGAKNPSPRTKYGLWLFGERWAGTSYIGMWISGRMAFVEGFPVAEQVAAEKLLRELRTSWSAGSYARQNPDDVALYWESVNVEDSLHHHFFGNDLLFIDDLHHETVDMSLWKKHVQPLIEERVKDKKLTVIATTMPPNHNALPKNVVEGLFHPVFCDGFRPEHDAYPYDQVREDGEG